MKFSMLPEIASGVRNTLKAVAGGGGKGMRKVNKALEFDDALEAAKREAKAAFGNDDEAGSTRPRRS